MANFGTPTVIGTLSSSTSQTTYNVPIIATTAPGDYLVVIAGSNGGGSNGIPTGIVDTQLQNSYAIVPAATSSGVGQLTVWILPNSKVLTNTDTVNVTYAVANTSLKNIIVIDCPGALIIDAAAIGTNAGTVTTNGQPTVSANLSSASELVLYAEQNTSTGGSPSTASPYTTLSTLHSGSGEYTTVSYQIVTTGPGSVSGSSTVTTGAWGASLIGLLNSIPLYVEQQPFDVMAPTSLAFNPLLQFKSPLPQPAIPTVISSAPVNIIGAQSNVFTPGINSLIGNANSFNTTTGGWTNGGNTTFTQTNIVSHNAAGALQVTCTAGGVSIVSSSAAAKIFTNGMPVQSGDTVVGAAWVLAATTGRTAQIGIGFFDINSNQIGSTTFGSSITDSTTTWSLVTFTTTAPAGALFARISVQFNGNGTGENHFVSDAWLFDITYSSPSSPGSQVAIYTPENQQFLLSPNGLPRPLNLNPAYFGLNRQIGTALPTVFQQGATATVNVSAGAGSPSIIVPTVPEFPFNSSLPSPLKFIPALARQQPQIPLTSPTIFIDGGAGGQVAVNAQFTDIAVVVSVTADPPPNVSVVAPSPPTIITGVTATVNVTAQLGNEAIVVVTASAANVGVSAVAGLVKESLLGAVVNVNVAAIAGAATAASVGIPAQVSVAAINGSIKEIIAGQVANVGVASTGVAVVTPQGNVANVNVQAIAGIATDVLIGQPATVAVASSGSYSSSLTGTTANVSASAIPGTPTAKTVFGVTANVAVASTAGAQVTLIGVTRNVSVTAIAGSAPINIQGVSAVVNVATQAGLAGLVEIGATLVNPDLAEDIILSRQGKLLNVPVSNMLVSADEI